jgi:hypothetical protein
MECPQDHDREPAETIGCFIFTIYYTILVARERESSNDLIKTILTWASRVSNYLATEGRVNLLADCACVVLFTFFYLSLCSIKLH